MHPTQETLRSNPHPYAIKTTSTGLLSRSSSTHSATAAHHFVPASPTRHRASASDLPRPLPVPPGSPTREHPSASQPNLPSYPLGDLPDDPRSWSPSDLSVYLSSSLRVTSPDLSPLAAHDLAAFVRAHAISGKKFLRLADGDLDNYGLTQRWLDALLRASRVLRQNSIRGRIWNTSDEDVRRGRTQSGSGRVKGMVASFERSSSPTKSSSSASSLRSISPVKHILSDDTRPRPRPQSDTFPGYHHMDPDTKKEPRLLPYPPSPASTFGPPPLLPQDTSSSTFSASFPSGVLPFSPQSTGSPFMLQTPPPPPQSFSDVFYTDTPNARPLPFPPHSGQYYPSPPPSLLVAGGGGFDRGDRDDGMKAMPPPRGMMVPEPGEDNIRSSVPHVHVDQEQREHAVYNDSSIPSSTLPMTIQQPSSSSIPFSSPPNEILAPKPHRHASERESLTTTKMLEEKLEELLEPRPRSRMGVVSHSRVVSTGSASRPRSRVASINGSWGRKHANGAETPGIQKRDSDGSMKSNLGVDEHEDGQRMRVISISSRSHTHRLSGVEVWGETHPHYHRHGHSLKKRRGIPFGEGEEGADEHGALVADERLEDEVGKDENETGSSSEDGEIGNIESVLEKSESLVGGGTTIAASASAVVEDGVAMTKEPKSSVITVLETSPNEEEEEESMEALLEREGENGASGAEAWEMIGEVDTIKRVGNGAEKTGKACVGDVFSSTVNDTGSSGDTSSPIMEGEGETKIEEEEETRFDQKEEERELEKRVRETREMVEDARRRLENVEMWIEKYEKRVEKQDRQNGNGSSQNDGMVMKVLKGFSTLFGFNSYYHPANTQVNGNGRTMTATATTATTRGRGRAVRLGIGLSSCVVLFGIGVCMVLLRLLGRRPVAGYGLGRMVGHWVVLNAGGGRR